MRLSTFSALRRDLEQNLLPILLYRQPAKQPLIKWNLLFILLYRQSADRHYSTVIIYLLFFILLYRELASQPLIMCILLCFQLYRPSPTQPLIICIPLSVLRSSDETSSPPFSWQTKPPTPPCPPPGWGSLKSSVLCIISHPPGNTNGFCSLYLHPGPAYFSHIAYSTVFYFVFILELFRQSASLEKTEG